jgi:hypothetical protein
MAEYTSPIAGRGLTILRLGIRQWQVLRETRRQGSRFSLIFSHEVAHAGPRNSLVILSIGKYPWDKNRMKIGLMIAKRFMMNHLD